jgi:hypothetical protein
MGKIKPYFQLPPAASAVRFSWRMDIWRMDMMIEKQQKMSINYHKKIFKSIANTGNGEVGEQTLFHYQQQGNVVWAEYSGGAIVKGFLVAKVIENDALDMRYQHINITGEIMTGLCLSRPEILPDGRIRLHEKWRWTSGDLSSGKSIIEEIIQ